MKKDISLVIATTNNDRAQKLAKIITRINPNINLIDFNALNIKPYKEVDASELDNAVKKAKYYWNNCKINVFCEDNAIYLSDTLDINQPGAYIHRTKEGNKELSAEEIYNIWHQRVSKNPNLKGVLKKVFTLCVNGQVTYETIDINIRFKLPNKVVSSNICINPLNYFIIPYNNTIPINEMSDEQRNQYEQPMLKSITSLLKSINSSN